MLAELLPGRAKQDTAALQAKALLATVRPRDIAGEELAKLIADEADEEGHSRTQGDGPGPRPEATAHGTSEDGNLTADPAVVLAPASPPSPVAF